MVSHGLKVETTRFSKDEKAEFAVFDLGTWKGGLSHSQVEASGAGTTGDLQSLLKWMTL